MTPPTPCSSSAILSTLAKAELSSISQPRVVTIGISGASSSGKTTLSTILSEIFDTWGREAAQPEIVSIDDFFITKDRCPIATFHGRPRDDKFLKETKERGVGFYHVESLEVEEEERRKITGPDTDCWGSIDVGGLVMYVRSVQDGEKARLPQGPNSAIWEQRKARVRQLCLENFSDIITEGRKLLDGFREESTGGICAKPAVVFVEGFLLYSNEPPTAADAKQNEHRTTSEQKRQLMDLIDIPLFLSVTKCEAKRRRFKRIEYVDAEDGGERVPGQCWKTEGYFEEIAWKNWESSIEGVLGGDGRKIHVFEEGQSDGKRDDVEETVRWALGIILEEAKQMMGEA